MFHLFTFHYFHLLNFFHPMVSYFPILFNCLDVPPPHLLKSPGFYCFSFFPPYWKKSSFFFFFFLTYLVIFSPSLHGPCKTSWKLMLFETWLVIFLLCSASKTARFSVTNTLKWSSILLIFILQKRKERVGTHQNGISSHHLTMLKMKKEMKICFAL